MWSGPMLFWPRRFWFRLSLNGAQVAILLVFLSGAALAQERLQVQFDVPRLVACHEVPRADAPGVQPGRKVVEVVLEVSLLVTGGPSDSLREVFYRVESPWHDWEVVDYLPRTITTTALAGPVAVETRRETQGQLGGQGRLSWPETAASVQLNAGVQDKHSRLLRYELLPPQQIVAAAGTFRRRQGVYYKLRPHPQFPLEGTRQLVLWLQVPQGWRAGWLMIHCQGRSDPRGGLLAGLDRRLVCHQRSFAVGLYLYGDPVAASVVDRFLVAHARWQHQVRAHRELVRRLVRPGKFSSWNSFLPWQEAPSAEALAAEALARWRHQVPEELPPELAAALLQYLRAEEQLRALGTR